MINNIYIKPKVKLLNSTPLAIAEIAARTAYQSFEKSENDIVKNYNFNLKLTDDIDNSKLLENLSWVTFHHSVLEHIVFQFHIKDIGRGVLQEFSRHRIASLTVKSTRYTLGPIILYFIVSQVTKKRFLGFKNFLSIDNNMSVLKNKKMLNDEIYSMYEKLETIYIDDPEIFIENSLSKNQKKVLEEYSNESPTELYKLLINERMKRNVGDNFKFIVTDNFSTELIWTINLRSLKNFFGLRYSDSAWYPIKDLAEEIKKQIPEKYMNLIWKNND